MMMICGDEERQLGRSIDHVNSYCFASPNVTVIIITMSTFACNNSREITTARGVDELSSYASPCVILVDVGGCDCCDR